MLAQPAVAPADRGPGLVLLDESGEVVSATREADAWLDEVDGLLARPSGSGVAIPLEAHATPPASARWSCRARPVPSPARACAPGRASGC